MSQPMSRKQQLLKRHRRNKRISLLIGLLVLTLYYQHELSLKEIGLVLDISDARVCQLSKQAIEKAPFFNQE